MIHRLVIHNFKLIQNCTLEFGLGFNCITGETGTGKSMLLSALRAVTGENIDPDFHLNKSQSTDRILASPDLQLWFDLNNNKKALRWLQQQNYLESSSDEQLTENCLRRSYTATFGKGENREIKYKSTNYINGKRCTLNELQQLSNLLINIEAQGSFNQLTKPAGRLELLDQMWVGDETKHLLSDLENTWHQISHTQAQITEIQQNQAANDEKHMTLQWKIEQLEQLDPNSEDFLTIQTKVDIANKSQDLLVLLNTAEQLMDSENGILDLLGKTKSTLNKVHENIQLHSELTLIEQASISMAELKRGIDAQISTMEFDEYELDTLQKRFDEYITCANKLNTTPEKLEQLYHDASSEIEQYSKTSDKIDIVQTRLKQALQQYKNLDEIISQHRQTTAEKMQINMNKTLKKLAVSGKILCQLTSHPPAPKGTLSFDLNYHPLGNQKNSQINDYQPIEKIASGGELSRMYLAVFLSVSDKLLPCLVLDEIDVGIGGETAVEVGNLLADLAKIHQLILVTHLPVVAAHSEHHLIAKRNQYGLVEYSKLNPHQKQNEIKRMLGGENMPQAVKTAAKSFD